MILPPMKVWVTGGQNSAYRVEPETAFLSTLQEGGLLFPDMLFRLIFPHCHSGIYSYNRTYINQ